MTYDYACPRNALRISPLAIALAAAFGPSISNAAESNLAPVVVTATRVEQSSFDLPVSIDSVDAAQLRDQRLGANVSESLVRVPGTVVQNRETYAQEQSIIIRGFGARSQFGVRGIKLIADGIPASTPDGQGGSGLFDLTTAKRIEVLRGAFSSLYGNHSGGVVQVFTEDGPARPTVGLSVSAGSDDTWRAALKFGGTSGAVNYVGSFSRLESDGYREWSEAKKDQSNVKLRIQTGEKSSLTLVGNYLHQTDNLDPLGLTVARSARIASRPTRPHWPSRRAATSTTFRRVPSMTSKLRRTIRCVPWCMAGHARMKATSRCRPTVSRRSTAISTASGCAGRIASATR